MLAALDAAAALRRHASGEPKQTPEQQQQQQDEQQQDEQQQPGQGKSQDADSPGGASNADQASPERPMEATSAERRSRNPLLRAQMEQLQQLRGETRMIEQHHGDPLPPWQRWVVGIFGGWLQGIISDLMRSRIEEDFDVREWLDGAKDAFWISELFLVREFELACTCAQRMTCATWRVVVCTGTAASCHSPPSTHT